MSIDATILVDDMSARPDLAAEHGLSVLLEGPGRTVLFDAGATAGTLRANAAALGIDLGAVDAVVISHGHYDHTGGLSAAVEARNGVVIYAHPAVWRRRFVARPHRRRREIGIGDDRAALERRGAVVRDVTSPLELTAWLTLSGPVPGPVGRTHFLSETDAGLAPDAFEDEQFALVRGRRGLWVVTGCCHRGLGNTLRAASALTAGQRIVGVLGGLHLRGARPAAIEAAAGALRRAGAPRAYPCHCTGERSAERLGEMLSGQVRCVSAGTRLEL
ncbi:MAG: MBL fold metallo-hydrolase [Planctomycetota bacterium]